MLIAIKRYELSNKLPNSLIGRATCWINLYQNAQLTSRLKLRYLLSYNINPHQIYRRVQLPYTNKDKHQLQKKKMKRSTNPSMCLPKQSHETERKVPNIRRQQYLPEITDEKMNVSAQTNGQIPESHRITASTPTILTP